jgi:hypothetical protein
VPFNHETLHEVDSFLRNFAWTLAQVRKQFEAGVLNFSRESAPGKNREIFGFFPVE